jgi:hypothetical protein
MNAELIWHYGSYVLAVFGLIGMWMAGKQNRWGWAMSTCTQVLWIAYAILTAQYGFIPGSTSYMVVYIRNFLRGTPNKGKTLSEQQKELYRQVRYSLETSMEASDAESAVAVLDELIHQVKIDTVQALVNNLTAGVV